MDGGVFISYRREDAAGFAGRLCDSLERLLPDEPVFRDVDGLVPGQDFVEAIEARLRRCRACLAVIGRDWLHARDAAGRPRLEQPDDFVRLELIAALERPGVLVIPVLVEGAPMPAAEALPAPLRGLARRQAVSLRDDSWDADVARLVRSLQPLTGTFRPAASSVLPVRLNWRVGAAGVAVVLLLLLVNAFRGGDEDPAGAPEASAGGGSVSVEPPPPAAPEATVEATRAGGPAPASSGTPLAIPRISQVGSRQLIYTLMSATIERGGAADTVRARVVLENAGPNDANFWDASFRLVVGGDPIAPNSRLNTLVAAQATGDGEVTFAVPPGTSSGLLRIAALGSSGDIPLDFTRPAPAGSVPPPREARAIVTAISTEPRPLVSSPILAATLTGISTRRFANVLRVDLPVRLASIGRGSILASDMTLRMAVGDDVLAPTAYPSALIQTGATLRMAVAFEVPPDTTRVVLRATAGESQVEMPLMLQ